MDLQHFWSLAPATAGRRLLYFVFLKLRLRLRGLLAGLVALLSMSVAQAQLPYVEDFSTDTSRDVAQTTADWNTGLGQLRLPIAASLTGATFDASTAVEIINPQVETRSVALADLDGDGYLDVIFGVAGRTRAVLNNGSGNFPSSGYRVPDGGNTRSIVTGDVDRDGDIDFVEGNLNQPIRLYLNDGTGAEFAVQDVSTAPAQTDHAILVDINDDGWLDIVAANMDARSNLIFLHTGDPMVPFGVGGQAGIELGAGIEETSREVLAGDIDQDGDLDLVILNGDVVSGSPEPALNRVFMNQGAGTFATATISPGADDADVSLSGALGDMNGDGFPDLVVVNYWNTEASKIYFNDASGTADTNPFTVAPIEFEPAPPVGSPLFARAASLADADGDGNLDIFLTTESNDYRNRIYFNDGSGATFSMVEVGPVGQAPLSIEDPTAVAANTLDSAVGDIDNDGDLDWVVANFDATHPNDPGPLENNVFRNSGSASGPSVQQLRAQAVSLSVDSSGVESVRLTVAAGAVGPQHLNQVEYWVTGNGGGQWSQIRPDGRPVPIVPGSDVRWRALLRSDSPVTAASLMLDQLQLGTNQNAPLVVTPIVSVDLIEGDNVTGLPIVPDFNDADGDALSYSVTGLAAGTGLSIDPATGEISGTPNSNDVAASPISAQIIATDGGLTGVDGFTINVAAAGEPPAFDSTPVTAVDQDQPYQYDIVTSDPDAGETAQLLLDAPTLPAWLTLMDLGGGMATLAGTPSAADVGDHPVSLSVRDPGGLTVTQDFTISVANVNDAPVFTSMPVLTASEYVLYTYDITATDPDAGDTATMLITADILPNWLTLTDNGNGSATLTGTPDASHVYIDNTVSLVATDSTGATGIQEFVISVSYDNDPPVIISSPPVEGATAGSNYVYTIQATDADASHTDLLVFSADVLPGWLSLNNIGGGRARISGTPSAADAEGDNTVTVTVTDRDGLTDMQTFVVNISIAEGEPEFVSEPVLNATEGADYRYAIRVVDPNGDALAISATTLPGWLTFQETGDGLALLTGTPTGDDVGTHAVVLEAVELAPAGGLSATQQFDIEVSDSGDGPTISMNGDAEMAVLLGNLYEDPGATAFDEEDGDLTQAIVTAGNVNTSALGTYSITYTVADSAGNQSQAERTVRVVELSEPGGIGAAGLSDLLWLGLFLLAAGTIRRQRLSV